jgi:hypothetical protein
MTPNWTLTIIFLAIVALCLHLRFAHGEDATLPSAMLGTWCAQPEDAKKNMPMKRCAPRSPNAVRMTPHAWVMKDDHCRIVSVTTESATRWVVGHVCDSRPDHQYNWTFFRDGDALVLAQIGTFSIIEPHLGSDVTGCFTRIYTRDHLTKHPDQLVTSMRLHIVSDGGFTLRVTKRGSDDVLSTDGACTPKQQRDLHCQIDAHNGGGTIRVMPRGRDTVLLYLDDKIAVSVADRDDWLSAGKDDDVFRLDRVAERGCKGM